MSVRKQAMDIAPTQRCLRLRRTLARLIFISVFADQGGGGRLLSILSDDTGDGRWVFFERQNMLYLGRGFHMAEAPIETLKDDEGQAHSPGLGLSNWLWRPWYAKLWWAAIPAYWLAMGEPTRPEFLEGFAHSGYAAITHAVFTPITALAVLGAGLFRRAALEGRLEPYNAGRPGSLGRKLDDSHPASSFSISRRNREWILRNHHKT